MKPELFSCAKDQLSHYQVIKQLLLPSVLSHQNM